MPVGGVAGQPGAFQAEDDPGPAEGDLGDQLLESFPVGGAGAGVALVDVDDGDLAGGERNQLEILKARRWLSAESGPPLESLPRWRPGRRADQLALR